MKRSLALPLLLLLLNCTTAAPPPQTSGAVDEAMVRTLEEQERLGVLNRDTEALQRVWSEEFMVNSPFNQIAPNRTVVLNLVRQGMIHYSSFDRVIEQLRIHGDLAIVMGAETVRPAGNAALAGETVQRRFTHVWQKRGGAWRLIARHANNIPRS